MCPITDPWSNLACGRDDFRGIEADIVSVRVCSAPITSKVGRGAAGQGRAAKERCPLLLV
jgi:hypothetical protein